MRIWNEQDETVKVSVKYVLEVKHGHKNRKESEAFHW